MADQLITGTTLVEKESRSFGDIPVGGILAWAKDFTGVPALKEGFLECDGSVVNDPLSTLNGQTLPDLNGDNRFLRGDSTSGGTGGSETHAHLSPLMITDDHYLLDPDDQTNWGDTSNGNTAESDRSWAQSDTSEPIGTGPANAFYTNTSSTLPTYYGVVWVMRVR